MKKRRTSATVTDEDFACEFCGYSLCGLPKNTPCPECGAVPAQRKLLTKQRRGWFLNLSFGAFWLAAVCVAAQLVPGSTWNVHFWIFRTRAPSIAPALLLQPIIWLALWRLFSPDPSRSNRRWLSILGRFFSSLFLITALYPAISFTFHLKSLRIDQAVFVARPTVALVLSVMLYWHLAKISCRHLGIWSMIHCVLAGLLAVGVVAFWFMAALKHFSPLHAIFVFEERFVPLPGIGGATSWNYVWQNFLESGRRFSSYHRSFCTSAFMSIYACFLMVHLGIELRRAAGKS